MCRYRAARAAKIKTQLHFVKLIVADSLFSVHSIEIISFLAGYWKPKFSINTVLDLNEKEKPGIQVLEFGFYFRSTSYSLCVLKAKYIANGFQASFVIY